MSRCAVIGEGVVAIQGGGRHVADVAEADGESTIGTVGGEGSYNGEGAVKSAGGVIRDVSGEIIAGGFRAVATSAGLSGVFTTVAEAAASGGASRKTAGGTTLGAAAGTTASPAGSATRQAATAAAGAGSRSARCQRGRNSVSVLRRASRQHPCP